MSFYKYVVNLKIRIKLLLAFGSLVLLLVLAVLVFLNTLNEGNRFQLVSQKINSLNVALLEMDGSLKYFMLEGFKEESFQKEQRSHYLDNYRTSLIRAQESLNLLKSNSRVENDTLALLQHSLITLAKKVVVLESLLKDRGFKDFGKEGLLRKAIHRVENSTYQFSKVEMLMLRRHEKDFFLRKDLKYQSEFNQRAELFIASLASKDNSEEILNNLKAYRGLFNEVVRIEEEIGLKETTGYKGKINADLEYLKVLVAAMRTSVQHANAIFKQRNQLLLVVIITIQFVLGIILSVMYANILTKAIKELQHAIQAVSQGVFPPLLSVQSTDEIGKTKLAFNQLLERIKAAVNFSESLGAGELEAHYDGRFSGDVLAKSMIRLQLQLKEALEKQHIVNWSNQGSAMLNDILKNENDEISLLGDKIIQLLVQYLNANQGALYVLQGSETSGVIVRIATYAYDKKRYVSDTLQLSEGLVGQCFLSKEVIVLTEVPADYVKITSGLGEATPRAVILVPLVIQNRSMGVVELASFEKPADYKIEFLRRISENIASILAGQKTSSETRQLLHLAREREQRLAESEEELKQNAEEMSAVQEQMKRQQNAMENEIAQLKQQLTATRKGELAQLF